MIYFDTQAPWGGAPTIWAVRPNGRGLRKIAKGSDPIISPDGRRIYCKCGKGGGIGVMRPDGSHFRTIGHPSFPGKYLKLSGAGTFVTSGGEEGGQSIELGAARSTSLESIYTAQATRDEGEFHWQILAGAPVISRDGETVAFLESEEGRIPDCQDPVKSEHGEYVVTAWECPILKRVRVNVVNSDGSGLRTVASSEYNEDVPLAEQCFASYDDLKGFSGDGQRLLLYFDPGCSGGLAQPLVLRTVSLTGAIEGESALPYEGDAPFAQLSDDGTHLAFTGYQEHSARPIGLFAMAVDGSGLHRIAPRKPREKVSSWGKVVWPLTTPRRQRHRGR